MTHSPLTDRVQLTSESSARSSGIDRFIVHHGATTSLDAILSLFQPGGRQVSANYALGSDGTLVLAVDEDRRAWTSASAYWDGRAVTIEVANSVAGDPWPVSDAAFDKLARLIADVSIRYGFPINDDTVLTHQELNTRYGDSYPTACPGDLQRRKGELLALANHYRTNGTTAGLGVAPIEKKGDITMRYIWAENRGGLLLTETAGPRVPVNIETAQAQSKTYNGFDVSTREWDVLRQDCLTRLDPGDMSDEAVITRAVNAAFDAKIAELIADPNLPDDPADIELLAYEVARKVRAEFASNPLK